jgi:Arc/MetJ-type ribon-helix-helix transcriptional regulator
MDITLAKDVEHFVQERVSEGVSANANELVNDVLRAVRDQQATALSVTPELEAWLLESADMPATPLTASDFTGIRERIRGRIEPRPK